jgi:hypothetical protein
MIFLLSGACLPSVKGLETRQTSLFADFYTKKDTGKRTSALDKSQQKKPLQIARHGKQFGVWRSRVTTLSWQESFTECPLKDTRQSFEGFLAVFFPHKGRACR